jgi:exo-beta-1,3-glucanase (GH17 family)
MKLVSKILSAGILITFLFSCSQKQTENKSTKDKYVTAKDILGNSNYLAISYGGYRQNSRDIQPTIDEIKEDMLLLSAIGVRILRTYNVQLQQAPNILKAITELRTADPDFEMYVMLGAWIDCKNAWTDQAPDHQVESEQNEGEIARAVALAKQYPDIVKIIAVGNEAMVRWAESYYVQPSVILKWVNHLQSLKQANELPADLWITSSDDFASWGGADVSYHTEDLEKLIKAVDYISMHTYAYHNSHYNPDFWQVPQEQAHLSAVEKADAAMLRAKEFAEAQYNAIATYVGSLGLAKPIHIGETGWATVSDGFYGADGSRATDEYKQGLYYQHMREWTNASGISCFYFEAFDEQWKDAGNPVGSENHFGLFDIKGQAKYALWDYVDQGAFKGLTRDQNPIDKTFEGDKEALTFEVMAPPARQGSFIQ